MRTPVGVTSWAGAGDVGDRPVDPSAGCVGVVEEAAGSTV